MWRQAPRADDTCEQPSTDAVNACQVLGHSALVTALNPKSIGFCIAFVPQFMTPQAPLAGQAAVLIATFVSLAFLNALAYAVLADLIRQQLTSAGARRRLSQGGGLALITMGVLTATLRHPTPRHATPRHARLRSRDARRLSGPRGLVGFSLLLHRP